MRAATLSPERLFDHLAERVATRERQQTRETIRNVAERNIAERDVAERDAAEQAGTEISDRTPETER